MFFHIIKDTQPKIGGKKESYLKRCMQTVFNVFPENKCDSNVYAPRVCKRKLICDNFIRKDDTKKKSREILQAIDSFLKKSADSFKDGLKVLQTL